MAGSLFPGLLGMHTFYVIRFLFATTKYSVGPPHTGEYMVYAAGMEQWYRTAKSSSQKDSKLST
jgi:hypothetical protein